MVMTAFDVVVIVACLAGPTLIVRALWWALSRARAPILDSLACLHRKVDALTVSNQQVLELLGQIDGATNDVAARIQTEIDVIVVLREKIAAADPANAVDLDAVVVCLAAERDKLRGFAANPAQPVPGMDLVLPPLVDPPASETPDTPPPVDPGLLDTTPPVEGSTPGEVPTT